MRREYASLSQGLVGAWCPSCGDTGYLLRDRSPYSIPATLTGFTSSAYAASGSGVAVRLAANQYAQITDVERFRFTSPFSAFAWVRMSTSQAAPDAAVVSCISQAWSFTGWMIWLSSGRINAYWNAGVRASGGTSILTNTWAHVGIQWTGSQAQVWLNGRTDATASYGTSPAVQSADPFRIGSYRVGTLSESDRSMNGDVDDVRVYRRALTAQEIGLLASRRGIGLVPQRQRRYYPRKMWVNVGGDWKNADTYQNVGGDWKLTVPYINDGGTWK